MAFVGIPLCLSTRRRRQCDAQTKQPFRLQELHLCFVITPRYAGVSLLQVWNKPLGAWQWGPGSICLSSALHQTSCTMLSTWSVFTCLCLWEMRIIFRVSLGASLPNDCIKFDISQLFQNIQGTFWKQPERDNNMTVNVG